jgi:hypothetical protein
MKGFAQSQSSKLMSFIFLSEAQPHSLPPPPKRWSWFIAMAHIKCYLQIFYTGQHVTWSNSNVCNPFTFYNFKILQLYKFLFHHRSKACSCSNLVLISVSHERPQQHRQADLHWWLPGTAGGPTKNLILLQSRISLSSKKVINLRNLKSSETFNDFSKAGMIKSALVSQRNLLFLEIIMMPYKPVIYVTSPRNSN